MTASGSQFARASLQTPPESKIVSSIRARARARLQIVPPLRRAPAGKGFRAMDGHGTLLHVHPSSAVRKRILARILCYTLPPCSCLGSRKVSIGLFITKSFGRRVSTLVPSVRYAAALFFSPRFFFFIR